MHLQWPSTLPQHGARSSSLVEYEGLFDILLWGKGGTCICRHLAAIVTSKYSWIILNIRHLYSLSIYIQSLPIIYIYICIYIILNPFPYCWPYLNPSGLSSNTRQPAQIKIPGLRSAISRLCLGIFGPGPLSQRWWKWPPKTTSLLVEIKSPILRDVSPKNLISPLTWQTRNNYHGFSSNKSDFSID